ncbi:MAG TPA: VWA domain-containing protein, partial [Roseivirga sp.]
MKTIQLKILLTTIVLFLFACGGDDSENTGLLVTIEDQFVNLPSNVSVFFRVEDNAGNGVAGLKESDFVIYENGAKISEFEATRKIQPNEQIFDYHITLLLDLSGSVLGGDNIISLKEAAKSFIDEVVPGENEPSSQAVKVEIWWFDGAANIKQLQGTSTNSATLKAAIDNINPQMSSDNSTNLYGAVIQGIQVASQKLSQTRQLDEIASSAVVIFTDGTDQANRNTKGQALEAVKNADKDMALYTIGLGEE